MGILVRRARRHDSPRLSLATAVPRYGAGLACRGPHHLLEADQAQGKIRVGWVRGAKAAGTGALVYMALIILSITLELGGLINVVYGGWVALLGAAWPSPELG